MYYRNDGKGESNITQNGFTAYLLSAVARRKADYLHAKQRRQAREVLTDPDDLSTEESPGISDPTDLLCCIENAALEEVLNRISERDRYLSMSSASMISSVPFRCRNANSSSSLAVLLTPSVATKVLCISA